MSSYESHAPSNLQGNSATSRRSESASLTAVVETKFLNGPPGKIASITRDAAHPIEFKKSDLFSPTITSAKRDDLNKSEIWETTSRDKRRSKPDTQSDTIWENAHKHEGRTVVTAPPMHGHEASRPELRAIALMTVAALSMEAVSAHKSMPHLPHEEYEKDLVALTMKTNKELSPDGRPRPKVRVSMAGRNSFLIPIQ